MKNILMIGTGGTIASKQTEYGLAPGLSAEDILNYIPAVSKICEVDSLQVCNLDSTECDTGALEKTAGKDRAGKL